MEDDYGSAGQEDIYDEYDGQGEDAMGIDLPGQQGDEQVQEEAHQPSTSRPGGQEGDAGNAMQQKLKDAIVEANKWRSAFKEVSSLVGFSNSAARDPDVPGVLEAVQRLKHQWQALQDESREIRRREAALQVALADRNLEVAELRREVSGAWAAADPAVAQLRQLMLDPAVNREFVRMRAELDDTQRELKRVQEELAAAHFTQESKIGRQLMAKCRSLADENEEMGRELAEGKVQHLESQLAMAKGFAEEMRVQVSEMLDHCSTLNEEVEELQREVFALRRKVRDYDAHDGPPHPQGGGPGWRMMGPGGDMEGGGPPPRTMMMGGPGRGGPGGFRGGRGFRGRGRFGGGGPGGPGGMPGPPGMGQGGHGGPGGGGIMMGGGPGNFGGGMR